MEASRATRASERIGVSSQEWGNEVAHPTTGSATGGSTFGSDLVATCDGPVKVRPRGFPARDPPLASTPTEGHHAIERDDGNREAPGTASPGPGVASAREPDTGGRARLAGDSNRRPASGHGRTGL